VRGVDGVGSLAGEAEEDGAIGGVADASEGEGTEEIDLDAGGFWEGSGGLEFLHETQGGAHRTHSVGAGWADADLEKFEEACVHDGLIVAGGAC
jgi:hypothetical protein